MNSERHGRNAGTPLDEWTPLAPRDHFDSSGRALLGVGGPPILHRARFPVYTQPLHAPPLPVSRRPAVSTTPDTDPGHPAPLPQSPQPLTATVPVTGGFVQARPKHAHLPQGALLLRTLSIGPQSHPSHHNPLSKQ